MGRCPFRATMTQIALRSGLQGARPSDGISARFVKNEG